jgi:hypothetical protein
MDARSNSGAARILCVESDLALLESRCAVLKCSGQDAHSASPHLAEILLRSQRFDLIVISKLSDFVLHRIINLSDGADVLVLDVSTSNCFMFHQAGSDRGRHAGHELRLQAPVVPIPLVRIVSLVLSCHSTWPPPRHVSAPSKAGIPDAKSNGLRSTYLA